jgi:hypothetical protein
MAGLPDISLARNKVPIRTHESARDLISKQPYHEDGNPPPKGVAKEFEGQFRAALVDMSAYMLFLRSNMDCILSSRSDRPHNVFSS